MVSGRISFDVDNLVLSKGALLSCKMLILNCLGVSMVKVRRVLIVIEGIRVSGIPDYPETDENDVLLIQKTIEFKVLVGFLDSVPV